MVLISKEALLSTLLYDWIYKSIPTRKHSSGLRHSPDGLRRSHLVRICGLCRAVLGVAAVHARDCGKGLSSLGAVRSYRLVHSLGMIERHTAGVYLQQVLDVDVPKQADHANDKDPQGNRCLPSVLVYGGVSLLSLPTRKPGEYGLTVGCLGCRPDEDLRPRRHTVVRGDRESDDEGSRFGVLWEAVFCVLVSHTVHLEKSKMEGKKTYISASQAKSRGAVPSDRKQRKYPA